MEPQNDDTFLPPSIAEAKERTLLASERNKLANERTFLAWIRTGLASVGGGIAVMRLLTFHDPLHKGVAKFVGIVLILLGIAIFILSLIDYRVSYKKLKMVDGYAGSVYTVSTIAIVLVIIALLLFAITIHDLIKHY